MKATKIFKIWIISVLAILGGTYLIWFIVINFERSDGKKMYGKIKGNIQVYLYDTFKLDRIEQSMYITDTSIYAKEFLNYYKCSERLDTSLPVDFPPKYITLNRPVYLLHNSDFFGKNPVVEIIDIDTSLYTYNYERCYVYRNAIHLKPPNDSLFQQFIAREKKSNRRQSK
jgi:hypothetical protein